MVGRRTFVDRVTEQIAAMPKDRFIAPDLTDVLIDGNGKPITTNAEVSGILKFYGLARNTGVKIRIGRNYYTVWEKNGLIQHHPGRKGNEHENGEAKA